MVRDFRLERHATGRKRLRRVPLTPCPLGRLWTAYTPVLDAASVDPNVKGVRRFNELVAAERRVSATAIQTVGSKGYDGFAIALVTGP
jgi:hypothetical protein